MQIDLADPHHPQATALLRQSHTLMQTLFASEDNHYLSVEDLCGPTIHFFMATRDQNAFGCAALCDQGQYGEIKSMYVSRAARGTGTGALLLNRLEQQAKALNLPMLKLETGVGLDAAIRLYQRYGFEICGPFGDYSLTDNSVFMQKRLS